jgi:polyisoprenoid-binding protein YceI
MAKWTFEPGHSAAEFCARHMMVTWVRGLFTDIHGTLDLDLNDPTKATVEAEIDSAKIWSGEADRDGHLRAPDFLDVESHPKITFKGKVTEQLGENDFKVTGDLTIRGVTKKVTLDASFLGKWETPWWEGGEDKGPKIRAGFVATTQINRHDFGVSWNSTLDRGGVVVGDTVLITIDVEAILEEA